MQPINHSPSPSSYIAMAPAPKTKSGKSATKKQSQKYVLDASAPTNDKIFDPSAFEKFLHDRIKVDNRTGNLGDDITISRDEGKIVVVASGAKFSGRYLKYLTKKFLKKQNLRDWLRVISTQKGVYELRFFNVEVDDDEGDDDE